MTPHRSSRSNQPNLPPPYHYEKAYSSYRVEWEERSSQHDLDVLEVTDLQWVHRHYVIDGDGEINNERVGDEDRKTPFLLGITSLGEIVVWKIPSWNEAATDHNDDTPSNKPFVRVKLPLSSSSSSSSAHGMGGRGGESTHGRYKMQVASIPSATTQRSTERTRNESRKRNRAAIESEAKDVKNLSDDVLFVAGEGGLWRVSISALLSSTVEHDDGPNNSHIKTILGENRPISYIQVYTENVHNQQTMYLYALEQHCVSKWNIINDGEEGKDVHPIATYPLDPLLNPINLRTSQQRTDLVTTMRVVSNPNNSSSTDPIVLVGTSHGRVLIVPTDADNTTGDVNVSTPRFQSVTTTTTSNGKASAPDTTSSINVGGSVTNIMETDRNWWTIASTSSSPLSATDYPAKNNDYVSGGCLSTWHAPTLALVASCPTRESIHSIQSLPTDDGIPKAATATSVTRTSSTFYSLGNEGVVSLWNSPYQLERTGRIWTSPPSGKAIAICTIGGGDGGVSVGCLVAVAGVGHLVDIVMDRCCIATLHM